MRRQLLTVSSKYLVLFLFTPIVLCGCGRDPLFVARRDYSRPVVSVTHDVTADVAMEELARIDLSADMSLVENAGDMSTVNPHETLNDIAATTVRSDTDSLSYLEPIAVDLPVSFVGLKAIVDFSRGEANLKPTAQAALDQFVGQLRRGRESVASVRVSGHGDRQEKLPLSQQRARQVAAYLDKKLPGLPLDVHGLGSSRPRVLCEEAVVESLESCLQPNRRVEVHIVNK